MSEPREPPSQPPKHTRDRNLADAIMDNDEDPPEEVNCAKLCDEDEDKVKDDCANFADEMAKYFPSPTTGKKSAVPGSFSVEKIRHISRLLSMVNESWSSVPKLYIVLRVTGQLQALDAFIAGGINDFWFPFSTRSIPKILDHESRQKLLECQHIVLNKADHLEKGEHGEHQNFGPGESLGFKLKEVLGRGAFGEVDRIFSMTTKKDYARKRIKRNDASGRAQPNFDSFSREIQVLKRVNHHHAVQIVGSYTDPTYLALIMSPVADSNLTDFMLGAQMSPPRQKLLRQFFGCLLNGIAYLHREHIRHRDIKPENILVKGDTVLYTDFGIAHEWGYNGQGTTVETSPAMTPRYASPEIFDGHPRNTSSDIWSLGCVFLEMATVLNGDSITNLKTFLRTTGSQRLEYAKNQESIRHWINDLTSQNRIAYDATPFKWTQQMLQPQSSSRPKAQDLFDKVRRTRDQSSSTPYCNSCCQIEDDSDESIDAVEEVKMPELTESHPNASAVRDQVEYAANPASAYSSLAELLIRSLAMRRPGMSRGINTPYAATMLRQPSPGISSAADLISAINSKDQSRAVALIKAGATVNDADYRGQTPLHKASAASQYSVVEALLEHGANVNAADRQSMTALLHAARLGHDDMLRLLIRNGANLNSRRTDMVTPLIQAAAGNHFNCARILVDAGAALDARTDDGVTALFLAAGLGHTSIVQLLARHKATIDLAEGRARRTALMHASGYGRRDAVELLLDHGAAINHVDDESATALLLAAKSGHVGVIELLLSRGAYTNLCLKGGRNVLHAAVQDGHTDALRCLLDAGVPVDLADDDGTTPLMLSTKNSTHGNLACVRLLLERGAKINATTELGMTGLHQAAFGGHEGMIQLLIDYGADPNAQTFQNLYTPLHVLAMINGNADATKILLDAGANLDMESKDGHVPLTVALHNGHERMAEVIMAKRNRSGVADVIIKSSQFNESRKT
jgi:ankyrin repeat protein/tRNA A-37 threonylcarbamoyl transferase component Bud32